MIKNNMETQQLVPRNKVGFIKSNFLPLIMGNTPARSSVKNIT